jgi:MoaA/NifB/PqqE/SkfB family radical SAM enzyme
MPEPSHSVAVLFLTPACNMHCPFCGAQAGFEPMAWDESLGLLKGLKGAGVRSVVLGGGEPFLWGPDPAALAQEARRLGLTAQIGTNGLLAPDTEQGLKAFDRWILPVESASAGTHDAMRPHHSSHLGLVMGLLERLRRAGVEVTISSLVSAENMQGLSEVGAYLRSYAGEGGLIHAWHLYNFIPLGRGGSAHAPRFSVPLESFRGAGLALKRDFPDLKIYLRPDMYHSKNVSFHWRERDGLKVMAAGNA